ncbi:MAG: 16S rRNA (cytosine(1402)-N(4))-methyltransferase RsmH [Planctomycetota bacterium]
MTQHIAVLAEEIVEALSPRPGDVVVDGTMGGGGHTRLLAQRVAPSGTVVALDRDAAAVQSAGQWGTGLPVLAVHANYAQLPEVLAEQGLGPVSGIVLDLGLSSDQLADDARGFSFRSDGELDLRFDTTRGEPAWRLVERLSEKHLADLIYQHGEERHSRRIARRIVARRAAKPIRTAADLADIIRQAVPRRRDAKIDPATRTFQALRIAANDELRWLETALRRLPDCLGAEGKLAVISFHSLEDRRVKQAMRDDPRLEAITRRPILPTDAETARNPRSRSAKLRVARRVSGPGSGG